MKFWPIIKKWPIIALKFLISTKKLLKKFLIKKRAKMNCTEYLLKGLVLGIVVASSNVCILPLILFKRFMYCEVITLSKTTTQPGCNAINFFITAADDDYTKQQDQTGEHRNPWSILMFFEDWNVDYIMHLSDTKSISRWTDLISWDLKRW